MLIREIIRKKRDGGCLSDAEITFVVKGLTDDTASEGQMAAFAMAVYFQKLTVAERIAFTCAMRDSGSVLDWSGEDRPVVDKHSTGGIGDNVSLMLAPALAACGAAVPMISGRGLGHTGGTLDKLDAIPGYVSQPDENKLRAVIRDVGCAVIGQTSEIAPADKRLYGIRDTTATVSSIDLITASILSKKLAAGLDALVLDVKFGNGAFMGSKSDAQTLADSLVSVANGAGCRTAARLTDMSQPLATAAGNSLETLNAVRFLTGDHIGARLWDVTCTLAGDLLYLGGLTGSCAAGRTKIETAFTSGAAAEKFAQMVVALGGPKDLLAKPDNYLAPAPVVLDVFPNTDGHVRSVDTRAVGLAVIGLGGGRQVPTDKIDPRVGFTGFAEIGQLVGTNQPIAQVHAATQEAAQNAADELRSAFVLGDPIKGNERLCSDLLEGEQT
ncbi:MAG: thymidine phosphorylase [Sulfitobacter sp.]